MRRTTLPGLVVLLLAFGAPGASAWFSSTGSGSAAATTANLDAPTVTSAVPGAGSLALNWSSVTPPSSGPATYFVTRDGGAPAGDCPTSSAPSPATSCTDSGLTAGSHTYTVTAVWRSWTATSAPRTVTIASGAATHLVLAAATTTPTAGVANNLTITAKDAANNTVAAYTGAKSLTFSGAAVAPDGTSPKVSDTTGTPRSFGTATTMTFASGAASVSGADNGVLRLYKAETATLHVTDGSLASNGLGVTVAPAAATRFAVGGYPSSTVAGSSHAFAVTARDAFENTATGYAGTVAFSASNDAQAVLPANATLTAGTGSFSATFKTVAGGAKTLTATDTTTPAITGSQSGIAVTAAPASTISVVSGSGQSATSGTAFAAPLVALVTDAFANPIAGAAVTFAGPLSGASATFASAGCTSNTPASQCVATTASDGRATSSALTANAIGGAYSVSASASGTNTAAFGLTNTGDIFQVSVPNPQRAGTPFTATITARSGAATNTSYTGPKCLVFSGPANSPSPVNRAPAYPAQGACAAGQSSVSFSGGLASASVTLFKATVATTTLTAAQGAITGTSAAFAVNSAGVALSYGPACPAAYLKGSTTPLTINVPNDAFANPFMSQASLGVGLTLTGDSSFSFFTGGATASVNVTTGPATNGFSIVHSGGNNKSTTLTATAPAPFTAPGSCAITSGN